MSLPIYIDIDGTLTKDGDRAGGEPIHDAIGGVQTLIRKGWEVVLWSGRGTDYAKAFAQRWDLACVAIGKPKCCYDDNPEIRPGGLKVLEPEGLL